MMHKAKIPEKGFYVVYSDGHVVSNPKDWIRVDRSNRIGLRGEWERIWVEREGEKK